MTGWRTERTRSLLVLSSESEPKLAQVVEGMTMNKLCDREEIDPGIVNWASGQHDAVFALLAKNLHSFECGGRSVLDCVYLIEDKIWELDSVILKELRKD
jgi:hypothetical protein